MAKWIVGKNGKLYDSDEMRRRARIATADKEAFAERTRKAIEASTKWTRETVTAEMESMIEYARNNFVATLKSLPVKMKKPYGTMIFARWDEKFRHEKWYMDLRKELKSIVEMHIVEGATKGQLSPSFCSFLLKTRYGYEEIQKVEQKVEHTKKVEFEIKEIEAKPQMKQLPNDDVIDGEIDED